MQYQTSMIKKILLLLELVRDKEDTCFNAPGRQWRQCHILDSAVNGCPKSSLYSHPHSLRLLFQGKVICSAASEGLY